MQQETMLRQDLVGKEAEVCMLCFQIYKYLQMNFYGGHSTEKEES